MTVKQLIEELKKLGNDEAIVYLASDEEGNAYNNVDELVAVQDPDDCNIEDENLEGVRAGSIIIYPK